jgi:hypothetical protein
VGEVKVSSGGLMVGWSEFESEVTLAQAGVMVGWTDESDPAVNLAQAGLMVGFKTSADFKRRVYPQKPTNAAIPPQRVYPREP